MLTNMFMICLILIKINLLLSYFLIHPAFRPVATVEVAVANGFADVLHLHTF